MRMCGPVDGSGVEGRMQIGIHERATLHFFQRSQRSWVEEGAQRPRKAYSRRKAHKNSLAEADKACPEPAKHCSLPRSHSIMGLKQNMLKAKSESVKDKLKKRDVARHFSAQFGLCSCFGFFPWSWPWH